MASQSSILTYYKLKNSGILKNQRENAILRVGHLKEFTYHDIMHLTGMIQGSSARVLYELREQGFSVFKKMVRGQSTVQSFEWTNKGRLKYKEISERGNAAKEKCACKYPIIRIANGGEYCGHCELDLEL